MSVLFMVAGPAGSGKTTTGTALADRLGATVVDLDEVTHELVSRFLAEHPDVDEPQALALLRDDRYAELGRRVRTQVAVGTAGVVVAIAPFTREISAEAALTGWAQAVGLPLEDVHVVWLDLPPQVRLARMLARGASRDATVLAAAEGDAGTELGGLPSSPTPVVPHLRVDAARPVGEQVDAVVQRFGNGRASL